jgi:hypothetical protein
MGAVVNNIVIGIDPGADGAVAAVDVGGRLVLGVALCRHWQGHAEGEGEAARMTADGLIVARAAELLRAIGVERDDEVELVCEAPQIRPRQSGGAMQCFRAGMLSGALAAAAGVVTGRNHCPLRVVAAAEWTREMGLQTARADRAERKRHRVQRVLDLAPTALPMLIQGAARVEHDGAADAILIALWGAGLGRMTK